MIISKQNDVFLKLKCDRSDAQDLFEYFSFYVPGYMYMPSFKNKMWDGKIRLFNINTGTVYTGLLHHVIRYCKENGITYSLDPALDPPKFADYTTVRKTMLDEEYAYNGKLITPREYQIDAVHHALNKKRCLLLSPTSSGKSLIIYSIIRFRQIFLEDHEKILLIVPNTNLVEQMYDDFKEYSAFDKTWNVEDNCHKIYGGKEKDGKYYKITLENGKVFKFYGNEFIKLINNKDNKIQAKDLNISHEIDDRWIQKQTDKQIL